MQMAAETADDGREPNGREPDGTGDGKGNGKDRGQGVTTTVGPKSKGTDTGQGGNSNWVRAAVHDVESVTAVMHRWKAHARAVLSEAKGAGKASGGG